MEIRKYNVGQEEYLAVFVSWNDAQEILGHKHDGSSEDDKALVTTLLAGGEAPSWIKTAEGGVDESGWYLISPKTLKEMALDGVTENAEPTSRALSGTNDHWAAEEWVQYSMIDGAEYAVYFLFDADEITDDDGEKMDADNYPWDVKHISRVEKFERVGDYGE